jgi:hypothetical protein
LWLVSMEPGKSPVKRMRVMAGGDAPPPRREGLF